MHNHTYTHTYTLTHTCIYTNTCTHTHTHAHTHTHTNTHTHSHAHTHSHTLTHTYTLTHTHTHTHPHTHTDLQFLLDLIKVLGVGSQLEDGVLVLKAGFDHHLAVTHLPGLAVQLVFGWQVTLDAAVVAHLVCCCLIKKSKDVAGIWVAGDA